MTTEEAEASGDVVAGNILVHYIPVVALFDSGASHCFMSSRFVKQHSLPQHKMEYDWEISTGNGTIVTNKICKSCPVAIGGRTLEADMFVMNTGGYDVILGMAWLSRHHAIIDCRSRVVIFRIPLQSEFSIIGESRASSQSWQGSCAEMASQQKLIPVEEEYSDVFF